MTEQRFSLRQTVDIGICSASPQDRASRKIHSSRDVSPRRRPEKTGPATGVRSVDSPQLAHGPDFLSQQTLRLQSGQGTQVASLFANIPAHIELHYVWSNEGLVLIHSLATRTNFFRFFTDEWVFFGVLSPKSIEQGLTCAFRALILKSARVLTPRSFAIGF